MKRIDRLFLQIAEAKRLEEYTFEYALVSPAECLEVPEDSPNYTKWELAVYLSKGKSSSDGKMLEPAFFDTKDEALAAAEELKAMYAPTGKRIQSKESIIITAG